MERVKKKRVYTFSVGITTWTNRMLYVDVVIDLIRVIYEAWTYSEEDKTKTLFLTLHIGNEKPGLFGANFDTPKRLNAFVDTVRTMLIKEDVIKDYIAEDSDDDNYDDDYDENDIYDDNYDDYD